MKLSGWKIYIYGETPRDAEYVDSCITPICKHYDATLKVATPDIIRRNKRLQPAWGIGVIYLHKELFEGNQVRKLISDLEYGLRGYKPMGCYTGAKRLSPHLSCRYDLSMSIRPEMGIEYSEYYLYYRGEFGEYNIPDNNIPNQLIIK